MMGTRWLLPRGTDTAVLWCVREVVEASVICVLHHAMAIHTHVSGPTVTHYALCHCHDINWGRMLCLWMARVPHRCHIGAGLARLGVMDSMFAEVMESIFNHGDHTDLANIFACCNATARMATRVIPAVLRRQRVVPGALVTTSRLGNNAIVALVMESCRDVVDQTCRRAAAKV